jgi:ubiquitin carboxyl-terminal hydrolase 4/11/15
MPQTCYVNTIVQCLRSISPLSSYLQQGQYLADLNPDNPLASCKGHLVKIFDYIYRQLSERKKPFIPSPLLKAISRFSPVFEDDEQHDAQELLLWLLDNIHEDVNRCKKKESIELPDFDEDTKDEDGAATSWDAHIKRNDSIIVDTLHGQYKAKMECSICKKVILFFRNWAF